MAILNVDASGVAREIMGGLDGLFTSDEERAEAKQKVAELMQQPHILQAIANVKAAASTNWWVAGARPALLWVCAVALAYNWLLKDFITMGIVLTVEKPGDLVPLLPTIDGAEITGLVVTLLGLGGLRTFEKAKGIARSMG